MAFVPWRFDVFVATWETRFRSLDVVRLPRRWWSCVSRRHRSFRSGGGRNDRSVLVVFCPVELRKGVGSWLGAFVLLYWFYLLFMFRVFRDIHTPKKYLRMWKHAASSTVSWYWPHTFDTWRIAHPSAGPLLSTMVGLPTSQVAIGDLVFLL